MNHFLELFAEYGLLAVFTGVFVEQIGAPIPAFPFLLMAGMDGLHDSLFALWALVVAAVASMLADLAWFWAGQRQGQRVLSLLCKISISPDSCVRQSELSFAKRGVATLVISKFVPGLSTLAPPMAGAPGMSAKTFVIFNLAGSALWASSGIAMGPVPTTPLRSRQPVYCTSGVAGRTCCTVASRGGCRPVCPWQTSSPKTRPRPDGPHID